MGISEVLTVFFGLMIVLPVLYLLFTNNIIRAAFAFVISLLGLAAVYVLLHAELMAVVQIMIYAGGVIVLLIFGIMLTKRVSEAGVFTQHRGVVLGGAVSTVFFLLLVKWILAAGLKWPNVEVSGQDQVRKIGILFLTDHLIAFEVIAFLLLVALVGAAFLAKKSGNA
ncbi:MAG: NADH-quinone oxidoreductase subunit J [Marinoscillum sp.]|uniref:NADH-quinone oxidoreductase subunit J family protein n=1 Tax=Marinoscillum sp. TaxID=2024838 RepID=UPI0032F3D0F5